MGKAKMISRSGKAGQIRAPEGADSMDKLAHSVLDDLLHNIISDIAMKTHREEKMAKAVSAAIQIEKLACDASEGSTPDSKPDVEVETEAAIYRDGTVLLKGNPLQTTKEILCPKCHLPRLLHPTDGKGAKKPDPTILYCKKLPPIQKPGCDIYGQSWVAPGPGRGKKKKDMEKKEGVTDAGTRAEQRPPNVLSFPSATCSKCKRCVLISRLNNHMGSCIGNSGRNASRAAAQKLSNGNSQGDNTTPPSSQKPTPGPGSRAASPRKRDAVGSDDDDEGESEASHKKKKVKSSTGSSTPTTTKKVILKTNKPNLKKETSKSSSHLSQEQKVDDYEVPVDSGVIEVSALPAKSSPKPSPKPAPKLNSPAKKLKAGKPNINSPLSKSATKDMDVDSPSAGVLSSPTATR